MSLLPADFLSHAEQFKDRTRPITHIILHTPGRTFAGLVGSDLKRARARLESRGSRFYGHCYFGPGGDGVQLAPLEKRAQHSASLSRRYEQGTKWRRFADPMEEDEAEHGRDGDVVYDWWIERWPGVDSPLDIIGTREPNNCSIGIDLMPTTKGEHPRAQLEAAAAYCCAVLDTYGIVASMGGTAPTVLTHSDIDPLRRGTVRNKSTGQIVGRDWDLGAKFDYALFRKLLADRAC